MKTKYIILWTLLSPVVSAKHSIDYQVSAIGNLIYQLDCITQPAMFPCSDASFTALWESELQSHDQDKVLLERWRNSRTKLDKNVEYVELPKLDLLTSPNFPINANNSMNVLDQVRIMAFASQDLNGYVEQLRHWRSINDVAEETLILNHFWPRFNTWFINQKPALELFMSDAEALSKEHDIDGLLTAMQIFYRSDLPDDLVLPVYLVAHPDTSAPTSGLVFNENSLVEVLKGESARSRLAVVIHEIAHFYHERAPLSVHVDHMRHFINNKSSVGKIGYYLFNEAMATAIGNGLLEQRMQSSEHFDKYQQTPLSFYNNKGIDMAAKSAFELVKKQINNMQAIDNVFLTTLDRQWTQDLKQIKDNPQQLLRHMGLIILEDNYNDMVNEVLGTIRPSSAQINTAVDINNPDKLAINKYLLLDSLILAKDWQQVQALKVDGLKTIDKQQTGLTDHTSKDGVHYFIIVSQDKADIMKYVDRLLAL